MAQNKLQTKKEIIKFILTHPIKSVKMLVAFHKCSNIELVAVWYYATQEIKKRGIK